MPKRELARVEVATARVLVATHPDTSPGLADGRYALGLVGSLLYLVGVEDEPPNGGPRRARLRLAETDFAMAFGGPPYHSTLHLQHPVVGRLVISLDAIEFARHTEAVVAQAQLDAGWEARD